MSDQLRIPRVYSLSKAILKTAELSSPVWCRSFYFSAIRSSFRHVRFRVYIYNIVNRTNKQPDLSFEFFSVLLTFGRLKNNLDLIVICSSVKINPRYDIPH